MKYSGMYSRSGSVIQRQYRNSRLARSISVSASVNHYSANTAAAIVPDTSVSASAAFGGASSSGYANTQGHVTGFAASAGGGFLFGANVASEYFDEFTIIGGIPGLCMPLEFQFSVNEMVTAQSVRLDDESIASASARYHLEVMSASHLVVGGYKSISSQAGYNTTSEVGSTGNVSLYVDSSGGQGSVFVRAGADSTSSIGASGSANVSVSLLSISIPTTFAYQHNLGGGDLEIHFDNGRSMPIIVGSPIPEPSSFRLPGVDGVTGGNENQTDFGSIEFPELPLALG